MDFWAKIVPALSNMVEKNMITSITWFFNVIRETTVYDDKGIMNCRGLRGLDHLMALNTWLIQSVFEVVATHSDHNL